MLEMKEGKFSFTMPAWSVAVLVATQPYLSGKRQRWRHVGAHPVCRMRFALQYLTLSFIISSFLYFTLAR
jgi:hypothetical protein